MALAAAVSTYGAGAVTRAFCGSSSNGLWGKALTVKLWVEMGFCMMQRSDFNRKNMTLLYHVLL